MNPQITKIKNLAKDIYRTLGSGFSEDVYDKAMQVGLRLANIKYEGQKVVELKYKNFCIGEGYPDIIVHFGERKLIIELKAVGGDLGPAEEQQIKNYMNILKIKSGLLINFQQPGRKDGETKLEIMEVSL
jgi:GxxExxY protein